MKIYLLIPIIWLIVFSQHTAAVELTINDEEIDNPGLILKSKFKQHLPELQENLEIPVNEKQQSIRESFIPKKINYHHFGLRSRFKKDVSVTTTTAIVLEPTLAKSNPENVDSNHTDTDTDSDSDVNEDISSSASSAPKVHSRRSWIKDFLMFKEQDTGTSDKSKNKKKTSEEKHENSKLQSKITNYDDTVSDPRDLKRWVRLIADEGKDQPYVQSKYVYNNEIELDVEEFIKYLVEEQGFNVTDLEFLRSKNLDYGLGEIEQELNKLKETKGSPKVIDIGGEHDSDGSDSGSSLNLFKSITNAYFAIVISCLFFI
ncbi:putative GPI-anchored protein 46 [Candida tropicalis]